MTSIEESEKKVNISFFFFYYPLKTKKNVPLWYVNTFLSTRKLHQNFLLHKKSPASCLYQQFARLWGFFLDFPGYFSLSTINVL